MSDEKLLTRDEWQKLELDELGVWGDANRLFNWLKQSVVSSIDSGNLDTLIQNLDKQEETLKEIKQLRWYKEFIREYMDQAVRPPDELLNELRWLRWFKSWIDAYLEKFVNPELPEGQTVQKNAIMYYEIQQGGEIPDKYEIGAITELMEKHGIYIWPFGQLKESARQSTLRIPEFELERMIEFILEGLENQEVAENLSKYLETWCKAAQEILYGHRGNGR